MAIKCGQKSNLIRSTDRDDLFNAGKLISHVFFRIQRTNLFNAIAYSLKIVSFFYALTSARAS